VIRIEPTTMGVSSGVAPIQVPVWAWLMVLAALTAVYFMAVEHGATVHHAGMVLHEFFHDGRHFLSLPCH
jgi:hypothetical protein